MSVVDDPCPTEAELEAMLLGRLSAQQIATMQRHLDRCPACPAKADSLLLESRLMKLLTHSAPPGEESFATSPKLVGLMDQLEGLHPGNATSETFCGASTDDDGFPFLSPAQQDGEIGRLANYRVFRLLGRGGMGSVFLAEDTRLERMVGLKVLRPRRDDDPEVRTRFLREAKAMAAVKHDNIAVIHEVGVVEGAGGAETLYLAMERLVGESLFNWMRLNPRPPVEWVIRIGREAAAGLAAAHARGLIHRDVKPANLWLEAPTGWSEEPPEQRNPLGAVGRVKLIDFGLATSASRDGTDPSWAAGTMAYMAPEQFEGGVIDERVDLFSLGCVLYELATGEAPFPGRGMANWALRETLVPTSARDLNPAIPQPLSDLISRLLAEKPADRMASARAVEIELSSIEKNLGVHTRQPRSRLTAVVLAAAGLAVVSWVTIWAITKDRTTPQEDHTAKRTDWGDRPPFPAGPPDELWCERVADLPSQEQFRTVARKLEELNPGYDSGKSTGWVEKEGVIRFTIVSDVVHDIRPVRGLPDVRNVRVAGTAPGTGTLTDLSPLAGLRLHTISLENHPRLIDISPLNGIHITRLTLAHTGVRSLDQVDGAILEELSIAGSPVGDLEPLRAMPRLHTFNGTGSPIVSLEPLTACPIRHLHAEIRIERDEAVLRRLPQLATVNGIPVKQFWRSVGRNP